MYKVSEETLIDLSKSITELSALLTLANMGSKLEQKQVKKALDKGLELQEFLNNNYLKIES